MWSLLFQKKGESPVFCTRGAGRTCGFEGQDPDAERGATQIEYLFIVPDERRDFDLARRRPWKGRH
ncbi:hypothetical protein G205_21009 [Arthrobacter nitrophenolicus]|uniref:Uncharacterized protein n=1 Tax=Arthrobacter nitrophenolicus TaxID=683150 RepID=L8TMB9_9MICC|nr:hypothetical protein G205_21009 [Arthrobacter nitrophenolicus]